MPQTQEQVQETEQYQPEKLTKSRHCYKNVDLFRSLLSMPTELADGLGLRDTPLYSLKELENTPPRMVPPFLTSPSLQMNVLAKLLD
jgi:hypothetical protein